MKRTDFKESLEKFKAKAREQLGKQFDALVVAVCQRTDVADFDKWASTPNGSARLVAFHDAVSDADDTLEAVDRAIKDGDLSEARTLIALGRDSLKDRITELKGLL